MYLAFNSEQIAIIPRPEFRAFCRGFHYRIPPIAANSPFSLGALVALNSSIHPTLLTFWLTNKKMFLIHIQHTWYILGHSYTYTKVEEKKRQTFQSLLLPLLKKDTMFKVIYQFVVSTHLKNISQVGSNPPNRDEHNKNLWNHHLVIYTSYLLWIEKPKHRDRSPWKNGIDLRRWIVEVLAIGFSPQVVYPRIAGIVKGPPWSLVKWRKLPLKRTAKNKHPYDLMGKDGLLFPANFFVEGRAVLVSEGAAAKMAR